MKKGVKELSLPVYDPKRRRLHPRELDALINVFFLGISTKLYLDKKY